MRKLRAMELVAMMEAAAARAMRDHISVGGQAFADLVLANTLD